MSVLSSVLSSVVSFLSSTHAATPPSSFILNPSLHAQARKGDLSSAVAFSAHCSHTATSKQKAQSES